MIKLTRRLCVIIAIFSSLSITLAWAYWATNGFGTGTGTVGTLAAPTGVSSTYSSTSGAATISWTGVASPDGDATHVGYYVKRGTANVCGSPASPLPSTATSCADADIPRGTYVHTVTTLYRSWTASTSSTFLTIAPSVVIAASQTVPPGGTMSATVHGFDSGDTITFKLDSAAGTAITSPASVSTPSGSGSATATLTIPTSASSGTHVVYASGAGGGSATSASFVVAPPAATQLSVSGFPSTITAGTQNGFTVTAKDGSGNVATAYRGTVSFSTNDPQVTSVATGLPGDYTFVAADAGVHTFAAASGFTLKTAAQSTRTITATDTTNGTITGTQTGITVNPATAARLTLTAASTSPTAGAADNLTLTAKDAFGNTATGYASDKSLVFGGAAQIGSNKPTVTNKAGTAVNFGSSTTITFVAGVAGVSGPSNGVMRLYKAETATIIVSDGTINNSTGLSVTVSPATAAGLCINSASACTGATDNRQKGTSYSSTVSLVDAYGNLTTFSSGIGVSVTWSGDASGSATLTILAGSTTSTGSFTIPLPTTNNKDVNITASHVAPPTLTNATQTVHTTN